MRRRTRSFSRLVRSLRLCFLTPLSAERSKRFSFILRKLYSTLCANTRSSISFSRRSHDLISLRTSKRLRAGTRQRRYAEVFPRRSADVQKPQGTRFKPTHPLYPQITLSASFYTLLLVRSRIHHLRTMSSPLSDYKAVQALRYEPVATAMFVLLPFLNPIEQQLTHSGRADSSLESQSPSLYSSFTFAVGAGSTRLP
jgi:hypothetical protein